MDNPIKPEDQNSDAQLDQSNAGAGDGQNPSKEITPDERKAWEEEKKGMVEQIVALRAQKNELLIAGGKKEEKDAEPQPQKSNEVEETVHSILAKNKEEQILRNRKIALGKFYVAHKEFAPENDVNGVRMDAFNAALSRINSSDSFEVDEILKDFEDALVFIPGYKSQDEKGVRSVLSDHASMPNEGNAPVKRVESKLSAEQEAIRLQKGWTVDKYLQMKEKYPKLVP